MGELAKTSKGAAGGKGWLLLQATLGIEAAGSLSGSGSQSLGSVAAGAILVWLHNCLQSNREGEQSGQV